MQKEKKKKKTSTSKQNFYNPLNAPNLYIANKTSMHAPKKKQKETHAGHACLRIIFQSVFNRHYREKKKKKKEEIKSLQAFFKKDRFTVRCQ